MVPFDNSHLGQILHLSRLLISLANPATVFSHLQHEDSSGHLPYGSAPDSVYTGGKQGRTLTLYQLILFFHLLYCI